jgi:hypothetical protein
VVHDNDRSTLHGRKLLVARAIDDRRPVSKELGLPSVRPPVVAMVPL